MEQLRPESAIAVIQLCIIYGLNVNHVVNGNILDSVAQPLTNEDIGYIISVCRANGLEREEIELLSTFITRLKTEESNDDVDSDDHVTSREKLVSATLRLVDVLNKVKYHVLNKVKYHVLNKVKYHFRQRKK